MVLDAVMLDAVEVDVHHAQRVNRSLSGRVEDGSTGPFRPVEILWVGPSRGFASLAEELSHRVTLPLRYLLRGLGSDHAGAELVSYLLFDREFCSRLMELGRQDARAREDEIRLFRFCDDLIAGRVPADRVSIVPYERLMTDFEGVMRELLSRNDIVPTEALERVIRETAARQRDRVSRHEYRAEDFGLALPASSPPAPMGRLGGAGEAPPA